MTWIEWPDWPKWIKWPKWPEWPEWPERHEASQTIDRMVYLLINPFIYIFFIFLWPDNVFHCSHGADCKDSGGGSGGGLLIFNVSSMILHQFHQVAANPSQSRPLEQQLRGFMMENWAPMCTMMHHGNTIRGQCSTKDKEEVKFGTILNCSDMTAPGVSVSIPPIITSCGARPLLLVQSRAAASGSSVILMVWSALATLPFNAHNIFPKIFSSWVSFLFNVFHMSI